MYRVKKSKTGFLKKRGKNLILAGYKKGRYFLLLDSAFGILVTDNKVVFSRRYESLIRWTCAKLHSTNKQPVRYGVHVYGVRTVYD